MAIEYKEHEADIALVASGPNLYTAFAEGARGLFDAQADLSTVSPTKTFKIHARGDDMQALFVDFLNVLIAQRDIHHMLFSQFEILRIYKWGDHWVVAANISGEEIDPQKHIFRTEVKAATYCGLSYEIIDGHHILQCVLDV